MTADSVFVALQQQQFTIAPVISIELDSAPSNGVNDFI
jgi:hypothetical protein